MSRLLVLFVIVFTSIGGTKGKELKVVQSFKVTCSDAYYDVSYYRGTAGCDINDGQYEGSVDWVVSDTTIQGASRQCMYVEDDYTTSLIVECTTDGTSGTRTWTATLYDSEDCTGDIRTDDPALSGTSDECLDTTETKPVMTCVDYGTMDNTKDVTTPKLSEIKACDAENQGSTLIPCVQLCSYLNGATACMNAYTQGKSVHAGCQLKEECDAHGGKLADGGSIRCCETDNCNTNAKATLLLSAAAQSTAAMGVIFIAAMAALLL